jgi:hypothetical protein
MRFPMGKIYLTRSHRSILEKSYKNSFLAEQNHKSLIFAKKEQMKQIPRKSHISGSPALNQKYQPR